MFKELTELEELRSIALGVRVILPHHPVGTDTLRSLREALQQILHHLQPICGASSLVLDISDSSSRQPRKR